MLRVGAGDGPVQGQGTLDDAVSHSLPLELCRVHGADDLRRDVLHGGEHRHAGLLHAESRRHRQDVLQDPPLGGEIRGDVHGAVREDHQPPLVGEDRRLADEPAGGHETVLMAQDGPDKGGRGQDALHHHVRLTAVDELRGEGRAGGLVGAVQDSVILRFLAHFRQEGADLPLLPDEHTPGDALALGFHQGAEGGLILGGGQGDAHPGAAVPQNEFLDFLKRPEHGPSPP